MDVTPVIEMRRAAMRAFESQFHDPGSTEPATMLAQQSFLDTIEARAREYGAMINVEFAEGFLSARPPRIATSSGLRRKRARLLDRSRPSSPRLPTSS